MIDPKPYSPLDVPNLAESIVRAMEERDPVALDDVPRFAGAGLYAIYYTGDFAAYEPVALLNAETILEPLYVGKAVPAGSRRGLSETPTRTFALSTRVRQHAASIRAAENLGIEDFWARWLAVEDIWIPLGESAMIRRHRPVWNAIVDGFGNHDPGAGRRAGTVSRWDVLHPGRSWTRNFAARDETMSDIEQDVAEYLRSRMA